MNCMNHPSAKKQTAIVFYVWSFFAHVWAFSAAFAAQTDSDGANVSLVTLSNFYHSYADWEILRQALPRKKPVYSIARGCFHTAGRVWGVLSGNVTLFVSCEATGWPRLQGGCISGRLRPTHLVAQVDDSKTMGYVLTGRFLFWSRCI